MKGRKRAPDTKYLNVRLPIELHRDLAEAAEQAKPRRSLNDEILTRLYRSFHHQDADKALDNAEALFGLVAKRFGISDAPPRFYGLLAPADKIGKPMKKERSK